MAGPAVAGVLVASCGGGGGGAETEPVRFWHAMGGPLGRALGDMVDDYNAANPQDAVESVSIS